MVETIGETLVRMGAMNTLQLEDVLRRQSSGDTRLFGEIAIDLGYIDDQAVQSYLDIKAGCPYCGDCHFYNIKEMVGSSLTLKEIYCEQWPKKCAIFQAKSIGKPISITLWPNGKRVA